MIPLFEIEFLGGRQVEQRRKRRAGLGLAGVRRARKHIGRLAGQEAQRHRHRLDPDVVIPILVVGVL